jgi:hypothetical protein
MAKAAAPSIDYGTVISYDPTSDTATVQLDGAGAFDQWIAGVKPGVYLDRSFLVYGAQVTLSVPDPHRLCDITITAVTLPGTNVVATTSAVIVTRTGMQILTTDASGNITNAPITFPVAFSAVPSQVSAGGPFGYTWAISGISATGFSVTLSGGPHAPNIPVMCTWSATGNS